ncbi:hypothetical protein VIGAN_09051800 [Vigna angularis var. angularis]|uniref:Uncharacterized protein n=1 Tax=Vigna angularis var. angularis TaxID=157739 RepID=A0A0S3SWS8_PHAAN|nr:hypothetical protein VIGAN_09051800 [Vigna angularis var. angularis]
MFHVKDNGDSWGYGVAVHQVNVIIPQYSGSYHLHLSEADVFTQTTSWSCIECNELVRGHVNNLSSLGDPPLWYKFQAIFTPIFPLPFPCCIENILSWYLN